MNYGRLIEQRLNELGSATTTETGIWRAIYTKEEAVGRGLLKDWMEAEGLSVREDAVGNLYGRIEGKSKEVVLAGSHMDTVRNGGKYDGAAGVVTAVCALGELLRRHGTPEKTVEVVGMVEEEGSRFEAGYLGSKAIAGELTDLDMTCKDASGISFAEAMQVSGRDPRQCSAAIRTDVAAYAELHIEQGLSLEQKGISIGIVENIVGLTVYDVTIRGKQNHAGTTPMSLRLDPMTAAARAITEMTDRIQQISGSAVLTVGRIHISPGMSNVIGREVNFQIDLRDGRQELLDQEKDAVESLLIRLEDEGYSVEINRQCEEPAVALNEELTSLAEAVAGEKGISSVRMNSGAGHDAQIIARKIPACVIFMPSKDGISHDSAEYTKPEDLKNGFRVLSGVLEKLAWQK